MILDSARTNLREMLENNSSLDGRRYEWTKSAWAWWNAYKQWERGERKRGRESFLDQAQR